MARPLEERVEKELLRVLRDEEVNGAKGNKYEFKKVCDSLLDDNERPIFGTAGSELRRKVQRRRHYLLARPGRQFHSALTELLVSPQRTPSYEDAQAPS